jgi:predicted nucleic acid-binding protein
VKAILIDSDVLIDVFAKREPFFEYSSRLLTFCAINKLSGFVTPLCLSNCFYVMRKVKGSDVARRDLRFVLDYLDILTMNRTTVLEALDSGFTDFEDALQHASAKHDARIEAIITRNTRDFEQSRLPVFTPEAFLQRFF